MPHIAPIDPAQAAGETADIFREIASAFGMVPNLFRTSAHHLPLLRANRAPQNIPEETFRALRQKGTSDAEIVEALGVMELFVGFNRFLDALQVDLDVRSRQATA